MQKITLFGLLLMSIMTLSGCLQNNGLTNVDDDVVVEVTTGITVEEIAEETIETPVPNNIISTSGESNKSDDDTTSQPASPAVTTTTQTTTTTDTAVTFSLTDVAQHATSTDCRTAVDNNVYNVSSFVSKHPGGEQKISQVCGIDATRIFVRQHGSNTKAKAALASFQIGVIAQ